ncbi:hypothetical protein QYM36_008318 [Artemia franciscana]|uniref:Reverse transcriptase domain-containing protein n=1 Tax=Artemia franciscana TaxID=6661 RepID=A0AA88LHZ6_ARTSF|nr:hypothetical protein QYM36_008318 [Artemia franciscana]
MVQSEVEDQDRNKNETRDALVAMDLAVKMKDSGLGINVSDLDYVDDIDDIAADPAAAYAMLNEIAHFFQLLGMKINTVKTKVMDLNIHYQLILYGQEMERVDNFTYLGSVINPHGGSELRYRSE